MKVDLSEPMTYEAFGELVGVSFQHIGRMVERGTLPANGSAREWLHAYISRLREEAAGRATTSGMNLADERAALARVQRELRELELGRLRGELIEVMELTRVLAATARLIRGPLESLPVRIKRAVPQLPHEAAAIVNATVTDALRQVARLADDPAALNAELQRAHGPGS